MYKLSNIVRNFKLQRCSKFNVLWPMWLKNQNFVTHTPNIIIEDLRIAENKNLENQTKGPNYRKSRSINFRKAYFKTDQTLESCTENISTKNKLETSTLTPCWESVLTLVKEKLGLYPSCWFLSKIVNAVNLVFCSIK